MENKPNLSALETFFFEFTRLFAACMSVLGFLIIAILIVNILDSPVSTHIALEDINTKESTENNTVEEASAESEKKLKFPANVKKYLSGDNEQILEDWISAIQGHDKKQDFITNMSEVITDAENNNLEVVNVINNYKTLKFSKLTKSEIEQYKDMGQEVALYSAIFGLLIFIALMSLILVLLAIERNTRGNRNEEYQQ